MKQAFYVNINPKDALTHPQIVGPFTLNSRGY